MLNKIELIQYPKPADRLSFSPFCLKLETYLRAAHVPYENHFAISYKGSKKKKMPMISDQNELIEDSTFVIQYLKQKYAVDLDQHLTSEQKAIAKAFQWLCEKSLADIIVYFRWVDQSNWPKFREIIFSGAPWIIKSTVANIMAKSIEKTLHKHGMGRFSDDEKLSILDDNLSAISNFLDNKSYFFGDTISSIDITLFSFLVQIHSRNVVNQFKNVLIKYPNLLRFIDLVKNTYWPEVNSKLEL